MPADAPRLHRSETALSALLFGGLALVALAFIFTQPQNYLVTGWDFRSHQFFLKTYLGDSLRAGAWPLWNPYICAGRPFAADPQSGVFYPPNWLYAVLPLNACVTLLVTLHVAAAGWFAYLLGRRLRLSAAAAAITGVAFMFNAFIITHAYRGQSERVEAIAYLPLMLMLLERAEQRRRLGAYVWLGLAGALQFLAGSPQVAWMTWVSVGVYLAARRLLFIRREGFVSISRSVAGLAIALAFTVGLAAVQLLPTLELVKHSNRSAPSVEFAAAFPFTMTSLVHLMFPNFEGEGGAYTQGNPEPMGYVGLLTVVLAIVGAFQARRRLKWAVIAVGAVQAFIMIGRATPVFDALYYALPGMSAFRIPARSIVVVTLCAAVLAGMGADAMFDPRSRRAARWVGPAAALALCVSLGLAAVRLVPLIDAKVAPASTLWIPLTFGAIALLAVLPAAFKSWTGLRYVWIAIIAVDLGLTAATMDAYRAREARNYRAPAAEAEIVQRMKANKELWRFALPAALVRENVGMANGVYGVNGFISLSLDRFYRFVHAMARQRVPEKLTHTPGPFVFQAANPFPFKVLNVRYGHGVDPATGAPTPIVNEAAGPRAWFVSDYEVIDDDATIERMLDDNFDPLQTVLLTEPPSDESTPGDGDADSAVEITAYSPQRIALRVHAATDGFLVLSEMDYPGWQATVDGKPADILRADYLLRAIPLKAGAYDDIEFRYAPASFTKGWIISLLSAGALIAIAFLLRKKTPDDEEDLTATAAEPSKADRVWTIVQVLALFALCVPVPWLIDRTKADTLAFVGGRLTVEGKLDEAARVLAEAHKQDPRDEAAIMNLGVVAAQQGRLEEALDYLQQAVKLNPESARCEANLGVVLFRLGRDDEAIAHLKRSNALDADYSESYFQYGRVLGVLGRVDEAAPLLNRLIDYEPGRVEAYKRVAEEWVLLREYERAIGVLQLGLQRLPHSADLAAQLADILATCPRMHLRDKNEALRLATFAVAATGSREPDKLKALAEAYRLNGDNTMARAAAQRALALAEQLDKPELADKLRTLLESLNP